MLTAMHAAAYMRWVETRKGVSPLARDTQRFIQGLLDIKGVAYSPDDLQEIEILALAADLDAVHAFIKDTDAYKKLDQAASSEPSN